jgi:hypothetical protein
MEQVSSVNLVTCAALVYRNLPVKALAGCKYLAHVLNLPLGGFDLLVMTLQTYGSRIVPKKPRIARSVGVVAVHAFSNLLKRSVLDFGMLHSQSNVLVAGITKLSHRLSQQFRPIRSMCVMAFQATFLHGLVNGSRLLHPVGEDHMAVQTHFARFLTEQFRLVRHVRGVTPQAPPLRNRLMFHLSLYRLCMTLLAQRPGSLRAQTGARLPAVGIVTLKTAFLRHWLVGISAHLELVTKNAETASLTGQLECVLYSVPVAVASSAGAYFQRPVQDFKTGHVRMAATSRAIFRWRGWTLRGSCLGSQQRRPEKPDKEKNHPSNQISNIRFVTARSQCVSNR